MATARKTKSGYYVVSYRDEDGKGRTRSFGKGREGKKLAEQFATEVEYKKAHGEALPLSRVEGIYLDELCQLWADEKKAQGRKTKWLKDWAAIFNSIFSKPLCQHPAHRITQANVIAIIGAHYHDHAQSTRNRYIGYIKSILEFGVEQGHLKTNPLARWKKGKETRHKSPLTLEGLKAIREAAAPHLAWALEVAWNIPARPGPSDLFSLRFDLNVKPDRQGVEYLHSKVGRWAFVRLDADFIRALAVKASQHRSGYLIEFRGQRVYDLGKSLENAATRAGLPYTVCMYDVRHLWITTALDSGLEPSAIAYMAGTSVEMIHKNYYEPHAAEKARALEIMPRLREPKAGLDRKIVGIEEAVCRKTCRKNEEGGLEASF